MPGDVTRERVLHRVLERQAARYGGRTYIYCRDGEYGFAGVNEAAGRVAAGLQQMGIGKGDKVAVVTDNCPQTVFLMFGLSKLGATLVPINTSHKGEMLKYLLDHSDSRVVVTHSHYLDRLVPALRSAPRVEAVVVLEKAGADPGAADAATDRREVGALGRREVEWSELTSNDGAYRPADVRWSDPLLLLYTSGTTGPSKGVLIPHNYLLCETGRIGDWMLEGRCGEDDRILVFLPLFHMHAWHGGVNLALTKGARIVLTERFSASRYWEWVRQYGCTIALNISSVSPILYKAQPRPDDAENSLRVLLGGPTPKELYEKFEQRFGVRLVDFYGMTEIGGPTTNQVWDRKIGSCGRVHPDYAVKIVDDDGVEVATNAVGEILARPMQPYAMMLEYYKMPEKTVETWRDLWFHTGDYGFFDEDGYLWFADRKKDALRRRGENISSFELERIINSHPAVLESAVIGVKAELEDEEVMACVNLIPGKTFSHEEFVAFCEERMAYFMVPRFVRLMESFPKTPSLRVEKYKLRAEGITTDTWDREAAGYKLKR